MTPQDMINHLSKVGYTANKRDDGFIDFCKDGQLVVSMRLPAEFSREDVVRFSNILFAHSKQIALN